MGVPTHDLTAAEPTDARKPGGARQPGGGAGRRLLSLLPAVAKNQARGIVWLEALKFEFFFFIFTFTLRKLVPEVNVKICS